MEFYHDVLKGKYYEKMTFNWLLKKIRKNCHKYIKYVGDRKKFYDFELLNNVTLTRNEKSYKKIESKVLGFYNDYLFLEIHSRYEYGDPGWAFKISNNKIYNQIKKDVLYTFSNEKNKKIVVIGGYDLCKIGKFLHLSGKKIKKECKGCLSKLSLFEIKINNKSLDQTVQSTHEKGYHSVQVQIPLKDIEVIIGKKAISIDKGSYLLKEIK